jgi:glycosyltransferase involved in cell wall biosynthesis
MRIGLFMTYGMSLTKWRDMGILSRELNIYKLLLKKKILIKIFSYDGEKDKKNFKNNLFEIVSLEKYIFFKNKHLKFINILLLPFFLKKNIINLDILKSNQTFGSWVPMLSAILYKKFFLHRAGFDFYSTFIKINRKSLVKKFFLFIFLKIIFINSHLIIVTSVLQKKNLARIFGLKKKKIFIQRNYIDAKLFKPFYKRNKKLKKTLLFVGRISKEKNIDLIIQSLKDTGYSLMVIGGGDINLKKYLTSIAKENRVKLTFLGIIKNNLLSYYYNKYKFFINFSDYEGNPKSVIESMACGGIVICSYVNGNKELIKNNFNGYLIKKNVCDLNKFFLKLKYINTSLVSINATKYAKNNFSINFFLKKEIKYYKFLLNNKSTLRNFNNW